MRRLAYLFPTFPVLHQTFTVGEVLGLERLGHELVLVSLKRCAGGPQQPEAERLADRTLYCPPWFSASLLAPVARAARSRPRALVGLILGVVRAWRAHVPRRSDLDRTAASTMGWRERLRGVYHCDPLVYLAKSLALLPHALFLAERFRRMGIDHVHAHWASFPATVAWMVRRWSGITYSFTAHAYDIHMVQRMLPVKIEDAEFVVTCAELNRRLLAKVCPTPASDRITVSYHGTDLERFRPMDREPRGEGLRIVGCGSLEEYKGFHYLLDAVALLSRRGIDVSCELAGDGPQRGVLEAKARDLGIANRVVFQGFLDQPALARLYARSDVLVMPSVALGRYGKQDVIPNVLAEAMACGLPVIASRLAGIPELVEHGDSGLLVPQRDASALADALARLAEEPSLARRLAERGCERVREIWDREKNLRELSALFEARVAAPSMKEAA